MNMNDGPTYSILYLTPIWVAVIGAAVLLLVRELKK